MSSDFPEKVPENEVLCSICNEPIRTHEMALSYGVKKPFHISPLLHYHVNCFVMEIGDDVKNKALNLMNRYFEEWQDAETLDEEIGAWDHLLDEVEKL